MKFWDSSAVIPLCFKEPESGAIQELAKAESPYLPLSIPPSPFRPDWPLVTRYFLTSPPLPISAPPSFTKVHCLLYQSTIDATTLRHIHSK
jgi:hypothetical protein